MTSLEVVSDICLQLRSANQRNGKKRKSGLLEDDTNSNRCEEVQGTRRKLLLKGVGMENVQPETIKNSITEGCEVFEIIMQTPTIQAQNMNIFPCDIERCEKDGHLFSLEYLLPIISAVDSNEEKSVKLFPKPNYLSKQSDLRPPMRTILFGWLVEVHQEFELREVVLWMAFQICDRFL